MPLSNELHNRFIIASKKMNNDVYLTQANVEENEIYKGNMFIVSHLFTSVANDGYVYVRIKTGSTKTCLFKVQVNVEAKVYTASFTGTTYSANGTALTPYNLDSESTKTVEALFYHTPTVNVLGTQRLEGMLGGGTNPSSSSTGTTTSLYTKLGTNKDILLRAQNKAGQAKDIGVFINFIEI